MTSEKQSFLDAFIKDKKGKITLWQWPNAAIYGWLLFKLLGMFTHGAIHSGSQHLSTAFLFAWAYMEITSGVNYFRRLLGFMVIVFIVLGFFHS